MPEYTYHCLSCDKKINMVCSISSYKESIKCSHCGSIKTERSYIEDLSTLNTSIKKNDSELKTIGDLADRNRDRMSNDEKSALYIKHNEYKEEVSHKELPKGMSRVKKGPKTIWPS